VGKAGISIFDCLGREIMPVLDRTIAAGSHSVMLNENNFRRGVYFVRMEHGGVSSVVKFQATR
jgi:hypothetical protein